MSSREPSAVASKGQTSRPAREAAARRCALVLLCVVALSGWPLGAATFEPAGAEHPVTSPEAQAQLRRTLEQNIAVLEAQATVVKTVAKLIGPSVVHIEADVPQQTLEHVGDRHIEEAGSGVIIQRNGRFYVLTNRHVFRNAPPDGTRIRLADGRQLRPQRHAGG